MPLPFKIPLNEVPTVIAGVVVELATLPVNPFAVTTDTPVTVPVPPAGAQLSVPVPSLVSTPDPFAGHVAVPMVKPEKVAAPAFRVPEVDKFCDPKLPEVAMEIEPAPLVMLIPFAAVRFAFAKAPPVPISNWP